MEMQRSNQGMALLTATIFVAVATLALTALSMRAITQSRQIDQSQAYLACFEGLESALATSKVDIEAGGTGLVGLGGWTPPALNPSAVPSFDDEGITPLTLPGATGVEYFAHAQNWETDGIDNNGDGVVDGPEEMGYYSIASFAQNGPVRRQTESVMRGEDVNVWRNAIFGGTGQAGGLINGNVAIHGSVHLLGSALPAGAEAINAIDLSGTSLIHNNYDNLDPTLASRVPPLPQRNFEGESVDTLNTVLRVKQGLVSMSGNSEIGSPQTTGNDFKETLDGTYVQDGWAGNSVTDDGGRGDPGNVYSDNGWDVEYDLGDKVDLPVFADDWIDMYTGARAFDGGRGANYTHFNYFTETLSGTPYSGDLTIRANQDFYYNATRPGDTDPANRQASDDYILFDAASNVMEINGQVTIDGNLTITRGSGNDKTIYYNGRAAVLARGDVTLDTDLLTVNADGTTANSFPANNCFGIMAENNMTVGSLSQLQLMGAFYAQNQIRTEKQSTIMGTFVSNYFDMGTNVPRIYQVPTLPQNLPYGMIGGYPIMVYSQVSWREVGV